MKARPIRKINLGDDKEWYKGGKVRTECVFNIESETRRE
jgi:hypothetical protein